MKAMLQVFFYHARNELRQLITEIEFTIYRSHELRFRAAQALEIIFRDWHSANDGTNRSAGRPQFHSAVPSDAQCVAAAQNTCRHRL